LGVYGEAMATLKNVESESEKCEPEKPEPRITLLICALNEKKNLPYVLGQIPPVIDETLIVDGHSTDGTIEMARKAYPNVKVLTQPGKGKGDALRYGIANASGDIVVMLDADGSMSPHELSVFIEPLLSGYDFVKGSRFIPGGGSSDMPRHRKFGNWAFTSLTNLLHRCRYTDLCYGYNAFWKRRFVESVAIESDGFEVETEINIKVKKAGLKVLEVPSFEDKRRYGRGNLNSFKDGKRILARIIKEFGSNKAACLITINLCENKLPDFSNLMIPPEIG
jgi:glycosyltransferase involved in cell wall biosynthesis